LLIWYFQPLHFGVPEGVLWSWNM